ncbi:MAG: MFS transporter [Patescibacteria group bacterium]
MINKEIKLLSLSFLLIFFGYNATSQYLTTYFSTLGLQDLGFRSLILIFLSFLVSGPISAIVVSKYGAKKSMIIACLFYFLFIASLMGEVLLIYLTSILVGFAASLLWTGQNSYLVKASVEKTYGENSGFFNSALTLGSACGILLLGLFISTFNFKLSFLIYSTFPLMGLVLLSQLKDFPTEQQKTSQLKLVIKSIRSKTALKLSAFYFSFSFIFGLVLGLVPLEIKNTLSIAYVGVLTFIFWIMPILFSYISGKISDVKGRKIMIFAAYIFGVLGLTSLYFSQYSIPLIVAIVLLALSYAIFRPMSFALVGDVSVERNLVPLTALFWMAQNIAILLALLISSVVQTGVIYLISIVVIIASLIVLYPLLKLDFKVLRLKLSQEVK